MGSGNSKEGTNSSPSKHKSEPNHKEVKKEKVKSEATEKVEAQRKPEFDPSDNEKIKRHEEKKEKIKDFVETPSNASVTKTHAKKTTPVKSKDRDSESSSDEEEEDIGTVLAATRKAKEEEERNKRNMRKPETEEYPETYAQRLQREQYLQQSLLRQKTFHKNPDEWNQEEIENQVPDFDVSKFKAVNQQQQLQKQDIYGNPELRQQPGSDPDSYYSQPTTNKKKAVPRYDSNEEELMADIEKEFLE